MNKLRIHPEAKFTFLKGTLQINVPRVKPLNFEGLEILTFLWEFQNPCTVEKALEKWQPALRKVLEDSVQSLIKASVLVPEGFKAPPHIPVDIDEPAFRKIFEHCSPYAMGEAAPMYSLFKSIEYIVKSGIRGDVVECGVWRGGSSMSMAMSLMHFGDKSRMLYLYDTFEGVWSAPVEQDKFIAAKNSEFDKFFKERLVAAEKQERTEDDLYRHQTSLEEVREHMLSTGYPKDKIKLVKGFVEDSIPKECPETLAMMRLDTDFYASTRHELVHLYPRLSKGGVLLIDDYGHYMGAREATDEYLKETNTHILLQRVGANERIAVKN
jgi:O-methyltransferase